MRCKFHPFPFVYSCGCRYALVVGELPFASESLIELRDAITHEDLPFPPSEYGQGARGRGVWVAGPICCCFLGMQQHFPGVYTGDKREGRGIFVGVVGNAASFPRN